MKLSKILLLLTLALATGCGGGGGGGNPGTAPAPTLVSIAVSPVNPSVTGGASQQFAALGTYSDSSTQSLTASATWSSSSTSVATISNATGTSGLATAMAVGTTTITATSGLVSGFATLTVTGGAAGGNVLPLSINGPSCSSSSTYPNKPCVSVTVCAPGTSNCQTISDILLDTGSYGLRIFSQALTVLAPPPVAGTFAECIQFGDGTSVWGPVQMADVVLGSEPAVRVPIQVIDATFGATTLPAVCRNADLSPAVARFTGILGVGLHVQDCGPTCVSSPNNGIYFTCNGTNCSGTTVPLASQIPNPVALLPRDNNGVIVQLPSVPAGGMPSVSGSLVLGIGTQANNNPASVTAYSANTSAQFSTLFSGVTFNSFLDTGSNGIFFSPPAAVAASLPACAGSTFFCPGSPVALSATNTASSGSPSGQVNFQIDNYLNLTGNAANSVFAEIGGTFPLSSFDWGLPFFFGKSVYVGFEGKTAPTLGTGPYWAY